LTFTYIVKRIEEKPSLVKTGMQLVKLITVTFLQCFPVTFFLRPLRIW